MVAESVKITVLVAVYNTQAYLRQCLDSLCRQTLSNIQIVCVDDCSTDRSPDILNEYAGRDRRITVMRTPVNSGQAAARHMGLQAAQGEYTTFVDSDDWLAPHSLATLYDALDKQAQADCALFRLVRYHETTDTYEEHHGGQGAPAEGATITGREAFRLSLDWTIHGVMAVRTHICKECGPGKRRSLFDDENMTRRQLLCSRRVVITQAPYYYRQHGQSTTRAFSLRRLDLMEAMVDLRRLTEREGLTDMLRPVERQLWLTIVDCYMLYRDNRRRLTADERTSAEARFRAMLANVKRRRLPWCLRLKPGYMPLRSYGLFRLQEELYFGLRSLCHNDNNA